MLAVRAAMCADGEAFTAFYDGLESRLAGFDRPAGADVEANWAALRSIGRK